MRCRLILFDSETGERHLHISHVVNFVGNYYQFDDIGYRQLIKKEPSRIFVYVKLRHPGDSFHHELLQNNPYFATDESCVDELLIPHSAKVGNSSLFNIPQQAAAWDDNRQQSNQAPVVAVEETQAKVAANHTTMEENDVSFLV